MDDHPSPQSTEKNNLSAVEWCRDELATANKRLKEAHENAESEYNKLIAELCHKEQVLVERLENINQRINDGAKEHGKTDASDDDVLEINAGGKIIVAKRSTLTHHTMGTRFEALFSGRWEKKLQRDNHGRIFLDVNSECFQSIVAYLNEILISTEDNTPDTPFVDDEYQNTFVQQLELFGLSGKMKFPTRNVINSKIIKSDNRNLANNFDRWRRSHSLSEKKFRLLFAGSGDEYIPESVGKVQGHGCTVIVLETTEFTSERSGGDCDDRSIYSKTRTRIGRYKNSEDRSELGVLVRSTVARRCAVIGDDMPILVGTSTTEFHFNPKGPIVKRFEIFEAQVNKLEAHTQGAMRLPRKRRQQPTATAIMFSEEVDRAINEKRCRLPAIELQISSLENHFEDEQSFIEKFASGNSTDVVMLNVSGTSIAVKRSTLRAIEDSVLAQQFDDSKWTERGHTNLRVKKWSADEVCSWVNNIEGIQEEDIGSVFKTNGITGCELLALNVDGLKAIGIERTGTLCILSKEIDTLVNVSNDAVSLIDHCPYCFGKILDYLRWKQLHAQGLAKEEPGIPDVRKAQKKRFQKVVNFYFPGEDSKLFLGR